MVAFLLQPLAATNKPATFWFTAQYFGGSVMAVAQDQVQRVVHDATIGMARGAQVLGFRVGCCCPAVMFKYDNY